VKIFSVADLCGVVPGLGICEMCQSFQGGVMPGHYGQGSGVLGFTIEWDELALGEMQSKQ